jgi:hypothetical protein
MVMETAKAADEVCGAAHSVAARMAAAKKFRVRFLIVICFLRRMVNSAVFGSHLSGLVTVAKVYEAAIKCASP